MPKFDPSAITTSRIASNDVTRELLAANGMSPSLRKAISVRPPKPTGDCNKCTGKIYKS